MGKKGRNINFRETHSERSATASYKNFHKRIKKIFLAVKSKTKFI